jgi:hypothetical protein
MIDPAVAKLQLQRSLIWISCKSVARSIAAMPLALAVPLIMGYGIPLYVEDSLSDDRGIAHSLFR